VCFHVPMSIMKHTMLVSSMGDEMIEDKHICPAISITIRGGRFSGKSHHPGFQGHTHYR
jgi:hypothetical protein